MANVWYGGTLTQHIEGHRYTLQTYAPIDDCSKIYPASVINKIFQHANNSIIGYSLHHQSVKNLADNLTVISQDEEGIIKALEGMNKLFMVLVQWHPESKLFDASAEQIETASKMSVENLHFFKHFVIAAKEYSLDMKK